MNFELCLRFSAGIGRTGTFIVIDIIINQIQAQGKYQIRVQDGYQNHVQVGY